MLESISKSIYCVGFVQSRSWKRTKQTLFWQRGQRISQRTWSHGVPWKALRGRSEYDSQGEHFFGYASVVIYCVLAEEQLHVEITRQICMQGVVLPAVCLQDTWPISDRAMLLVSVVVALEQSYSVAPKVRRSPGPMFWVCLLKLASRRVWCFENSRVTWRKNWTAWQPASKQGSSRRGCSEVDSYKE